MAWWLLDSVINGTLDEDYPIMSKKEKDVTILGGESETNEYGQKHSKYYYDYDRNDPNAKNPFADSVTFSSDGIYAADTVNFGSPLPGGMGEDHISFGPGAGNTAYDSSKYFAGDFGDDPYPTVSSSNVDDVYKFHFPGTEQDKPKPDLKYKSQKYQEDKGIRDLKDYVSSTYQGHYTNENSDVQTLDLIHSVGDAESFCRSNALKYLSRYDKKGSAKRDILKAMHYCLLLYYFSGNTQNEITTRGYETF